MLELVLDVEVVAETLVVVDSEVEVDEVLVVVVSEVLVLEVLILVDSEVLWEVEEVDRDVEVERELLVVEVL